MLLILKREKLKDNRSNKMESKGSKCQQLDIYNNKERKDLDKFEDEGKGENIRYISFLFVNIPFFSQKELTIRQI